MLAQIFKGLQAHFYTNPSLVGSLHQLYQDTTPDGTPFPNARFTQVGNSIPRLTYSNSGIDTWSFQFDVFALTPGEAANLIDLVVAHYHKASLQLTDPEFLLAEGGTEVTAEGGTEFQVGDGHPGKCLAIIITGSRLLKDPGVDPNVKNVYHAVATFKVYTQGS